MAFRIVDLLDNLLGLVIGDTMVLDSNAAGYGWFIDATPADSREFSLPTPNGELFAGAASPAFGKIDLMTAVMHELGHVLGLEHQSQGVMEPTLQTGEKLNAMPIGYPGNTGSNPGNGNGAAAQDSHPESSPRERLSWLFDELKGELILPGRNPFDLSSVRFDPSHWHESAVGQDDGGMIGLWISNPKNCMVNEKKTAWSHRIHENHA